MSELRYFNPAQNIERNEPAIHTIEVHNEDGEIIGGADIEYFSKPIPFYQVTDLWVKYEHHGKGYGSKVMQYVVVMKKKYVVSFVYSVRLIVCRILEE